MRLQQYRHSFSTDAAGDCWSWPRICKEMHRESVAIPSHAPDSENDSVSSTAFANGHSGLLAGFPPERVIFGGSERMQSLQRKLNIVAQANVPVLITGENGTGKEIMARMIHQHSATSDGPFVKVNCPAIPGTLLESELFGYERGAFTGAYAAKPGRVEMANRGTQAKLLQLLQDGQFSRIGGQEDRRVDVRVICATNRSLETEVASGRFRQDLFYRINVVQIQVPPLRHRAQDIPMLVHYFLQLYSDKFSVRP